MKILILSDFFPPQNSGGAEKVAFNLATGLKQAGHDVFVLTTTQEKNKVGENLENDLKIIKVYAPDYHPRWRAYRCLYNPGVTKQINEIIQNIKPDVTHAHNIHYHLSYPSLKIAHQYSQAVFLTAHDVMLFHYGKLTEVIDQGNLSMSDPLELNYKINYWQILKKYKKRYNPLRNIFIKHYLKYVDKIFTISYVLKRVLSQNGIENIAVIHNGIDINEWQVDNQHIENFKKKYNLFNKKIIFFGGRLSGLKGGGELIKAMQRVVSQVPEAVLLVIGKKNQFAQHMASLATSQNIPLILTGWLAENQMKLAYYASDLIVSPSICFDSFPTVNLEAMAAQKPVVGTCFGGTPEIVIDNQTGYIVNPLNTKMLAEKIIDLLTNPKKANEFGQAGYQRVKENFSLDKQIKETLKYYSTFCA